MALEQNRVVCKCLSPVAEDKIRQLYEGGDRGKAKDDDIDKSETATPQEENHEDGSDPSFDIFTEFIAKNFTPEARASLQKLVEEAQTSGWRDSILQLLNQCYDNQQQQKSSTAGAIIDFSTLLSDASAASSSSPQPTTANESPNLQSRSGTPLSPLKRLYQQSMVALRAAKASAIQSRMVTSSSSTSGGSSSHLRKARADASIQAIASDNRGRLFIAESSSILFVNGVPPVNVRGMSANSAGSHMSRSQLNILGSDNVKFPIQGLALCPENNRHLLVWGVSRACVAILSKDLDSFNKIIELKLNLDSSEVDTEYLVRCDWMPKSQTHVVAVCGTVVHVFDLKRLEKDYVTCHATTHYALAYEDVLIRSAALLGPLPLDDDCPSSSAVETKLSLLLDTGRIYFIVLSVDDEGNMEDHGESYIEIGSGVSFPTEGIRRYHGGDPQPSGSTATTFGEGVFIAYLRQSNLLLYQCASSCLVAMLLDDDGVISGTFGECIFMCQ